VHNLLLEGCFSQKSMKAMWSDEEGSHGDMHLTWMSDEIDDE